MKVMKFGGTSVESVEALNRVHEIVKSSLSDKPVVVCSAMGKTTSRLLSAAQYVAEGDTAKALKKLDEIRNFHLVLSYQLISDLEEKNVWGQLSEYFNELQKLFEGLSILKYLTPQSQDKILSYGELISNLIVSEVLKEKGVNAELIDARDIIKTDDTFTSAHVIHDLTEQLIREKLIPSINSGKVPVVHGFIASSREGFTTTLGFEGSDYTAALLASAIEAEELQIWKTVSGLMSTDPQLFSQAITVDNASYDEAGELTYFGAKCLHFKAIGPVKKKDIPVRILNSLNPSESGTLISKNPGQSRGPVKSITYKKDVTQVLMKAKNGTTTGSFLAQVLNHLNQKGLNPLILSSTKGSLSAVFPIENADEFLFDPLKKICEIEVKQDLATVSMIGESLRDDHTFSSIIMEELKGVQVRGVTQGASPINLSLLIDEKDVSEVIGKLHTRLFS